METGNEAGCGARLLASANCLIVGAVNPFMTEAVPKTVSGVIGAAPPTLRAPQPSA